jgi:1,4-alpha-glucan branching enzyme
MLYRDYSRPEGEWVPNVHGGRENLEAIEFLRRMNATVYAEVPGIVTIAEESTAWPGVSRPVHDGGLGFGYKWNMGWMNDTLDYMRHDPVHRRFHHHQLTFGLAYAFSENFVLPLSHDEVVHGKGSLLARMPGTEAEKFANLRAYLGFMWAHPGKKLLFMGGEFAQGREWNHDASLDWHLLDRTEHRGVQSLVRDLNRLYRDTPALHRRDCAPDGFRWLSAEAADDSVLAFARFGAAHDPPAVALCHFTPVPRPGWRVGLPRSGLWEVAVDTSRAEYGGPGGGPPSAIVAEPLSWQGEAQSAAIDLPPLATLLLRHRG